MISRIIYKLKNNFFLKLISHISDENFYIRLSSWCREFVKFPIISIKESEKKKILMDFLGEVPEDDVVPAKKIKLDITTEKVKNNHNTIVSVKSIICFN